MIRSTLALAALAITTPAAAQDAGEHPWSIALSGGTATLEGQDDQPFASATLTREIGDFHVRLTGTIIDSGDDASAFLAPARTTQGTLAGGYSGEALSIDAYASLGTRDFERGALRGPSGQPIAIDSNGGTAGAGLTVTYDIALDENWFVSPFLSADYNRLDVTRVATLANGMAIAQQEKEDGVTGTAGLTVQRLFGAGGRHSIGLYGAFATTSNATSSARGVSPVASARTGRLIDQPGRKDSWGEYGASGVIGLTDRLSLDLSIIRTAGFEFGETTAAAAGLRIAF